MADDPRVEQLLDELLDSHAEPEEVCGSFPELLPVVRNRWRQMRRLRADLNALFPRSDDWTPYPSDDTPLPRIPGYEVESVLGRGGMGVVFRARHLRLKRPVAIKTVLDGGYAGPRERARFQREAEAVAALRHPNVVQVYDVGDVDGRPYFTMEYLEGGSLAQRLAGAPQPARQAAQLVATLAGAVQAAHECGVIHRDLKPANVLLAANGTPKVTDFGLARRQDDRSGLTQTGVAIGTPSYMAPEQARGCPDAVGPAVDIYALGAILYELLTGRPPFRAATSAETIQQVISQEPAPPSRLNAQVPRDLETVCLKCLNKEPPARYATAAELTDDLRRFERGEPIAARRVGGLGRLARWARRRPAAVGMLAAVFLLVATGVVGAGLLYRQRADAQARQAQTDEEVRGVLGGARDLLEEGWHAADLAKLTHARSEGDRALDIAGRGGAGAVVQQEAAAFQEDATRRLERAERNRALLLALQEVPVQYETLAYVHGRVDSPVGLALPSADELYGAAFRRWGIDVDGTSEVEVVARLGAEPDTVVQELVAGLDAWISARRRNRPEAAWQRLSRVAERLDASKLRQRLRALVTGGAPARAEVVAGLVGVGSPWPAPWELAHGCTWRALLELRREIDPRAEAVLTVALLARAFAEVGDTGEAERLLREAVTARPKEVVLLVALGRLMERQGQSRLTDAIGYYRAARGQRPLLGIALGRTLLAAGKEGEAEEVLQELARQSAHDHDPVLFCNLGATLHRRGKYIEAEEASRKATDLQPNFAQAHMNLVNCLLAQHRYGEAEVALRKALDLKADWAEETQGVLGNALLGQQRFGEAEAVFRKALDCKPDWAEIQIQLGNALNGQGKKGEAEAAYRKAIDVKPDIPEAYYNLGNALMDQQRPGEAEVAYRKMIDLRPDFAEAHNNLGNALYHQGRSAPAEAAYRKALDLKPNHAETHSNLGNALRAQGKLREAVSAFRKAIDLRPDFAGAYYNLGNTLMEQRKHGEAEAAFRKTIDLKPDYAEAYTNLGAALFDQGRSGEAEVVLRKAVGLKPGLFEAHRNLGMALIQQARFDEATAALKKASDLLPAIDARRVQLRGLQQQCDRYRALDARLPAVLRGTEKPDNAANQIEFARLCHLKKHYAAEARLSADALAALPRLADEPRTSFRYNAACAAALAGCGHGRDADQLGEQERAPLRRQALDWLRQDLTWWGERLDKAGAETSAQAQVRDRLRHWQGDPDLVGVRAKDALAGLPDEERQRWERLWSDVGALLRRVSAPD